jgi:GNAT superfamily N-acetyltransferase
MPNKEPFSLRSPAPAERPAIAELINRHSQATLGTPQALIDEAGALRLARGVGGAVAQQVAIAPDGRLAGWAYVSHQEPGIVWPVEVVAPAAADAGAALLRWAEEQAQARLEATPPGARIIMQDTAFEVDAASRELLVAAGFSHCRTWIHLDLTMDAPPPPPRWPAGVSVRRMDQRHDWPAVGAALEHAFGDHWGELPPAPADPGTFAAAPEADPAAPPEQDDPYFNTHNLCFVALCDGEVVGSCLNNARTVEWPDSGRLGSLSIRRDYRRRGIAEALLLHAWGACWEHGIRRITTDTDADNLTGSFRLYQRLGMRIFRRELVFEKELRPGQELRVMA